MLAHNLKYAGFWIRTWTSVIDLILIVIVTYPLLLSIYGWSYIESDKLFVEHAWS